MKVLGVQYIVIGAALRAGMCLMGFKWPILVLLVVPPPMSIVHEARRPRKVGDLDGTLAVMSEVDTPKCPGEGGLLNKLGLICNYESLSTTSPSFLSLPPDSGNGSSCGTSSTQ